MAAKFEVYNRGLVHVSACTDAEHKHEAEVLANAHEPTGIASPWRVVEATFAGGEPNPTPCNTTPGRWHYLFTC